MVQEQHSVERAHHIPARRSADMTMYAGTVPFLWSMDIFLQEMLLPEMRRYITIHITAQGATTQVFKSETVEIVPDQVCSVYFLPHETDGVADSYMMTGCSILGGAADLNAVHVRMTLSNVVGGAPTIEVVDSTIRPTWLIGAREIILTDPPIMANNYRQHGGHGDPDVMVPQQAD